MKLLEEIKLDLLGCLKYMTKLLKETPRRKITTFFFCATLIFGLSYFFIEKTSQIYKLFAFCLIIFSYNVLYPIYIKFLCFKKRNNKKGA